MAIKLRLQEILDERGMSQRQLAKQMNVRPNTINHLCSDKVNAIYLSNLELICKTLSIHISDLVVIANLEE
jgi:putative transcriptional regulator